jgi:hypothetical protein
MTGDPFFETFGRAGRASVCACDTKLEPTLSQALHMVAGDTVQSQISAGHVIEKHLKATTPPEGIIEDLYLRTLSRKPKDKELNAMLELVGSDTRDRKPYQDIFWSLLNSTEFIFNH